MDREESLHAALERAAYIDSLHLGNLWVHLSSHWASLDEGAPPTFEGHGFLDADGLACARMQLADGTTPETNLVNSAYTGVVGEAVRDAWADL